jgi:hypothetical protein
MPKVEIPLRVRGPDEPVPDPGTDEQHAVLGADENRRVGMDAVAGYEDVHALRRPHLEFPALADQSWISSVHTPAALVT